MKEDEVQPVRLGIQYYIGHGWAIVIQAPYISRVDIREIQDAIQTYLALAPLTKSGDRITCKPDPYGESSSPYTHYVHVCYLSEEPDDIESFLLEMYSSVLDAGFRNPDATDD